VPQRRRYCWALRCEIVVLRRFALRRTDGSVGTTPTGRRRYGGGCATHRRQITKKRNQNLHNQEWLCHNVAELGAVVVVLGGESFEFGMCTVRSRGATTAALLLGIEMRDCCVETFRASAHRRERRYYADRASALRRRVRHPPATDNQKTKSNLHNQEWLCHNVAELGAVVVVLGGECFEFGMCTARSRCATTALLLGIEVCDCCAETIRAAVHRRERRCYADRASALRAFTRPSEKLGEPRCNSDTWGSHERSTNMRRHEDWILVGVTAVFRQ
jgi:hypothetical protein